MRNAAIFMAAFLLFLLFLFLIVHLVVHLNRKRAFEKNLESSEPLIVAEWVGFEPTHESPRLTI